MRSARNKAVVTRWVMGLTLFLAWPTIAAAGGQDSPVAFSTERVDRSTGSVLSSRLEADGSSVSTLSAGRLQLKKAFGPEGRLVIEVQDGVEALRVEIGRDWLAVSGPDGSIQAQPSRSSADDYEQIRKVVAGTSAFSAVRAVAAFLDQATQESLEGLSVLHAESILATLGGDTAAASRFAGVLLQNRPDIASPIEPARLDSCYLRYQFEVVQAFDWVEGCYADFAWWNVPARQLCAFEWTFRVEFAFAELLSCVSINPLPK
jgi:hypothetical protein